MIVECVECGKKYTLEDSENISDYQCECGGKLKKESSGISYFFDVFLPLVIVVVYTVQRGWSLLVLSLLITIPILLYYRNLQPTTATTKQKIIFLSAGLYNTIITMWMCLSLLNVV